MSKDLLVTRKGSTFVPYDELAEEDMFSLPEGKPIMMNAQTKRSLIHNRFYRLCIARMSSAGAPGDPEWLHRTTLIKCGFVKVAQLPDGEYMACPDSTAFDVMDQDAFNAYFKKAVDFWKASGLWNWLDASLKRKIET